jgi:hemoglobin
MNDMKLMVDNFYGKIREDELLADIFNNKIQNRWDEHLDKMYRFWQTVLLNEHTYLGSPFIPHAKLPVNAEHFDRWIMLFNETVDNFFTGEKAEKAKWQGARMAEMFLYKINFYRNNNATPIL